MDVESWQQDLAQDWTIIAALLARVNRFTPAHDLKLQTLSKRIQLKIAEPINADNRKVLVFSAFADTTDYLYRELSPELEAAGLHTSIVTGRRCPHTKHFPLRQAPEFVLYFNAFTRYGAHSPLNYNLSTRFTNCGIETGSATFVCY